MRGRVYATRGFVDGVPYVSGTSYRPVRVSARENRSQTPQERPKMDMDHLALIAVFALSLIADGATLLLIAWMTR